uniref:Thaumarchaeal output domain-containing protein n=1 Tax=candidate division WOR-3 bacterium TaxID=2052148 RepID=A0A7V3PTI8_UNCW3
MTLLECYMLNDSKILKLFELLVEKNLNCIEPVFAPDTTNGISYPIVESQLDVDSEYATQLLKDMCSLGYLQRQFAERVYFCPACNSTDLRLVLYCPKCNSPELYRTRLFRHRTCNYTAPADDFLRHGQRICPKCRNELLLLGSDYDDLGNRYRCPDCKEITRAPVERWNCHSCGRTYEKDGIRELILYKYTLNPAQVTRLRQERIPRARVRELLAQEGYEIQESVNVKGRSGAVHLIDMLADKRNGPLEHRVVIGFATGVENVDSEAVIKLYAKAYDVNAQDIILIASPKLSEEAAQFAQHYHIKVYTPDRIDQLAAATEKQT